MLGNLRSISIRTMQETQKSKLGLVVEGGGVRAIYAAGVLDVLHAMRLPFSGVIGVSAGVVFAVLTLVLIQRFRFLAVRQ